jgi:beta-glucosidase
LQCGGWTISWQGSEGEVTHGGTTILKALRAAASSGTEVAFSSDGTGVANSDVAVVVIAENPYAEMKGDKKDVRLSAADAALIAKVKAAGIPVVTVLLSGRPLILDSTLEKTDALVAAWLPGTEGQGVADVLFGDYKPTGKLSRNWPHTNEQLVGSPTVSKKPLFARGFGLSYHGQDVVSAATE